MLRLVLVAHAAQCLAFTSVSTGLRRHAYGSPAAAQRGRAAAATTQRRAVPMAIALPAPASKLMALVGTALEPPAPSAPKIEGSKLFRLLGIPPEAEYDEIQAAYSELAVKYKGDVKKLQKMEIAKDKIMELRLKQRMSGALRTTGDVAAIDRAYERIEKGAWKRKLQPPKWAAKVYVPPDADHLQQCATYFGIFAAAGTFFPKFITSCIAIGFVSSLGLLYQRGAPEPVKDDMGNVGEVRPPDKSVLGLTVGVVMGGVAVGAVLAAVGGALLADVLAPQLVLNLSMQVGFFLAAAFFKTYKVMK